MTSDGAAPSFERFRGEAETMLARIFMVGDVEFMALASRAIKTIDGEPQRDEAVAYLMTDVWLRCKDRLTSAEAQETGELFADLEIPDMHVKDAPAKWARLRALTERR